MRVIEADSECGHVKVRYIGYGAEWDEWRSLDYIVELHNRNSSSSDEATTTTPVPSEGRFCFYNELRNNIKSMLVAKRKDDPVCTIVMTFDKVYFV